MAAATNAFARNNRYAQISQIARGKITEVERRVEREKNSILDGKTWNSELVKLLRRFPQSNDQAVIKHLADEFYKTIHGQDPQGQVAARANSVKKSVESDIEKWRKGQERELRLDHAIVESSPYDKNLRRVAQIIHDLKRISDEKQAIITQHAGQIAKKDEDYGQAVKSLEEQHNQAMQQLREEHLEDKASIEQRLTDQRLASEEQLVHLVANDAQLQLESACEMACEQELRIESLMESARRRAGTADLLYAELDDAEAAVKDKSVRNETLKKTNARLTEAGIKEREFHRGRVGELEQVCSTLRQEKVMIENEGRRLRGRVSELENENENTLQPQINTLTDENSGLRSRVDTLQHEKGLIEQRVRILEEEKTKSSSRITTLEESERNATEQSSALSPRIDSLTREKERLAEDLSKAQARFEGLESSSREERNKFNAEKSNLGALIDKANSRKKSAQRKLNWLQMEHNHLDAEMIKSERALKNKAAQLEGALNDEKRHHGESARALQEGDGKMRDTESKLQQSVDQLTKLETRYNTLDSSNVNLRTQFDILSREESSVSNSLDALQISFDAVSKKYCNLKRTRANEMKTWNKERQPLEAKVTELEGDLSAAAQIYNYLDDDIMFIAKKLNPLVEVQDNTSIDVLRAAVDAAMREAQTANAEKTSLQRRFDACNEDYRTMWEILNKLYLKYWPDDGKVWNGVDVMESLQYRFEQYVVALNDLSDWWPKLLQDREELTFACRLIAALSLQTDSDPESAMLNAEYETMWRVGHLQGDPGEFGPNEDAIESLLARTTTSSMGKKRALAE